MFWNFPQQNGYYINISKLNSDNDYEFVTTDPSDGKIQMPDPQGTTTDATKFVDRVDGGDRKVNGVICAVTQNS